VYWLLYIRAVHRTCVSNSVARGRGTRMNAHPQRGGHECPQEGGRQWWMIPRQIWKTLAYVISCKLCSNSKKFHHNIPFQATSEKKVMRGGAGYRLELSSPGTSPAPVSNILAMRQCVRSWTGLSSKTVKYSDDIELDKRAFVLLFGTYFSLLALRCGLLAIKHDVIRTH